MQKETGSGRAPRTFARENASLGRDYLPGTAPREEALISDHPAWFLSGSELVGRLCCPPPRWPGLVWGGGRDPARAKVWRPESWAQLCRPRDSDTPGPLSGPEFPHPQGGLVRGCPRAPSPGPGRAQALGPSATFGFCPAPSQRTLTAPPRPPCGHIGFPCLWGPRNQYNGLSTLREAPRWQPSKGAASDTKDGLLR